MRRFLLRFCFRLFYSSADFYCDFYFRSDFSCYDFYFSDGSFNLHFCFIMITVISFMIEFKIVFSSSDIPKRI